MDMLDYAVENGAFDITLSAILAGIFFGVIGMWMFREGKKKQDFRVIFLGLGLMIYPYFTHGPLADWGVGSVLCGLAYYIW